MGIGGLFMGFGSVLMELFTPVHFIPVLNWMLAASIVYRCGGIVYNSLFPKPKSHVQQQHWYFKRFQ
jgi:hypothetical protein